MIMKPSHYCEPAHPQLRYHGGRRLESMSTEPEKLTPEKLAQAEHASERKTLRVIGWFSMGMAVATLGIYVGYELRSRYKFKRRTPYDFYSNAEPQSATDFGVGI
jgi:hypothetical protein